MPKIKVEKNRKFTVMSNYHLRDKNLSNKSRGLLSTMLSLPDDWDYTVEGLASSCKDGKESISAQLNCIVLWDAWHKKCQMPRTEAR